MSAYSLAEHQQNCPDNLQRAQALGVSLRLYRGRATSRVAPLGLKHPGSIKVKTEWLHMGEN